MLSSDAHAILNPRYAFLKSFEMALVKKSDSDSVDSEMQCDSSLVVLRSMRDRMNPSCSMFEFVGGVTLETRVCQRLIHIKVPFHYLYQGTVPRLQTKKTSHKVAYKRQNEF